MQKKAPSCVTRMGSSKRSSSYSQDRQSQVTKVEEEGHKSVAARHILMYAVALALILLTVPIVVVSILNKDISNVPTLWFACFGLVALMLGINPRLIAAVNRGFTTWAKGRQIESQGD
jgi:protein-S-isoprenylcysteine O-methyltransferase Ste14